MFFTAFELYCFDFFPMELEVFLFHPEHAFPVVGGFLCKGLYSRINPFAHSKLFGSKQFINWPKSGF
jgi:hypothetical protein